LLNLILTLTIFAVFLAMIAYVLLLIANNSRTRAIRQRTEEMEAKLLQAKIDQIIATKSSEVNNPKAIRNGYRKFRIIKKVKETENISSFYLAPNDEKPLSAFLPGQYLTFKLNIPGQPRPVNRCYSLSDSPNHPDRYRVTIKRIGPPEENPDAPPGLGSNYFHDSLEENSIVDVKTPGGHFFLDMKKNTPVVLLAGGVGITPVLSMLNAIVALGTKRETWFFLGVQNRAAHVMKDHLETVASENENIRLHICYSRPGPSDFEGQDYQHKERVSVDLLKRLLPSNNYDFFICAPPAMVQSLREDLAEWEVPKDKIHFEAFGPETVKKCKVENRVEDAPVVDITFSKSAKTIRWDPKMNCLLDFAEENGITMESGCRGGNCGSCITAIKAGSVTYISEPGAEPEAGSCLTCISVPKENLILDA
jgi:uncharacterized protein